MSDHIPIRADFALSPTKPLPQGHSAELKKFQNQIYFENPVSEQLKIHVNAELLNKNLSFDLYDINAKRIISLTHYFNENDLNYVLPFDLQKGMYIMKIKNENGWEIQRKLFKK
jgi:hypothetical protein